MASSIYGFLGTRKLNDLQLDSTVEVLDAAATTVNALRLDNRLNDADSYARLWNDATVTNGTDAPDMVLRVPNGQHLNVVINGGSGFAFGTALSVAGCTVGGTSGSQPPVEDFLLEALTN